MLFERIEREIEREAQRKGIYFPGAESVTIRLELNEEELKEWEETTCNKVMESEGYEFQFVENECTGDYDLVIDFGFDY